MDDWVKVIDRGNGVTRILINRPDAQNALNAELRNLLAAAIDQIAAKPSVRVVVIQGAGGKVFVSGADIQELLDLTPSQSEQMSLNEMAFNDRLRRLPIPVIAMIDGWCLGGGLELAMACDIRIASDTSRFGLPEINLAIIPGGGGTVRLTHLVGPSMARALCMTGDIFDANRAFDIGLVYKVVAQDLLEEEVNALAGRLATFGAEAMGQLKSSLNTAEESSLDVAQRFESKASAQCYGTPEQRAAMQAFLDRPKKRR